MNGKKLTKHRFLQVEQPRLKLADKITLSH